MASSLNPPPADSSALPYTDVKPVGAADFYAAINATFRFIEKRFGLEGLRRYWTELGERYYAPVSAQWRDGGLTGVARYWRAFFDAEPGAVVTVTEKPDEVVLEVQTCPAIKYLRDHDREIVTAFCQHCYFVSSAIGEKAGIEVRVNGGNGACVQRFARRGGFPQSQCLNDITAAT
jgi:hypothetical protein